MGGVIIGHDTIVAPNSVIIKNTEACSVYSGIPGKNNKREYRKI
ncbi:hypothetical protein [Fusobacterium polymorphum]